MKQFALLFNQGNAAVSGCGYFADDEFCTRGSTEEFRTASKRF